MRCPKCQYISFETTERCRNCGYELTLADEALEMPELPLRDGDAPVGPPIELVLGDVDRRLAEIPAPEDAAGSPALERYDPPVEAERSAGARPPDLPLFAVDEKPLVSAAPPRAPLAVRRATPEMPRTRGRAVRDPAEAGRMQEASAGTKSVRTTSSPETRPSPDAVSPDEETASVLRRLIAGALDMALLALVDAVVVYFTLRLSGLTFAQTFQLSWLPLGAFLLLLDGGYFVMFTAAGGQTIGKMSLGLRTVAVDGSRVRFTPAIARTAAYLVSAVPLGIGFVACLVGSGRRALHDRIARTRVVRSR